MKIEYMDWIKQIENANQKNKGKYDIIVPLSGGKDGTFVLWYLKKYTNLNVLAFHIDNYYVSDEAIINAKKVCKELDCDLEIYRPSWKQIQKFYKELLYATGEICIACEMMISLLPIEFAISHRIPYIAWGLTPKQIASKKFDKGIMPIDLNYYNKISNYYGSIIKSVFKKNDEAGCQIKERFLKNDYMEDDQCPVFIFPFYYLGYDATMIERTVSENTGWKRPIMVGGTSSNCVINKLHIYIKKRIKGEEYYKKILEKKADAKEVVDSVVQHALKNELSSEQIDEFLRELEINESIDEVIDIIRNYKKDIILKMESNISQ